MANHDDLLASKTTKYSFPPPSASNTDNELPPCTQRKNRSRIWDHFTINPESGNKRACDTLYHQLVC